MGELSRARKSIAIADRRGAGRQKERFLGIGHRGHKSREQVIGHRQRSKDRE
jgi:hypothetical protein